MTDLRKIGIAGALAAVFGAINYGVGRRHCAVNVREVLETSKRRRELIYALAELDTMRHSRVGSARWRVWTWMPAETLGAMESFETVLWESTAVYYGDPMGIVDVMIEVGFEPKEVPVLVDYWKRRQSEVP